MIVRVELDDGKPAQPAALTVWLRGCSLTGALYAPRASGSPKRRRAYDPRGFHTAVLNDGTKE